MSFRIRFILGFLLSFVRPQVNPLKEYRGNYRVWFTEAEFKILENARYCYFFSLERFRFIFSTDLRKVFFSKPWTVVMGAQINRIKRPLSRWQKFSVVTKPPTWDDKYFYFEQHIESKGKLICSSVVSFIFLTKSGKISPQEILETMGIYSKSGPLTSAVQGFIVTSEALDQPLKKNQDSDENTPPPLEKVA